MLLLLVAALLLVPANALAAEGAAPPTTVTTPTGSTGPTSTGTTTEAGEGEGEGEGSGESSAGSATDDTAIAVSFIIFAALGVIVLFSYLAFSQDRFFEAARLVFGQAGVLPEPVPVSAFARATLLEGATEIEIKGPATFSVGEEVTFSALSAGSEVSVEWEVAPAESASPASATGSSITFKASTQAVFTVTAKAPEGKGEAAVQVAAVTPPQRPSLPFIGENYGAALIAIVAVAGVVALGLAGAIKGEAIATFFGALLGYAFGKGVQSSQSGTPTTSDPGSAGQE